MKNLKIYFFVLQSFFSVMVTAQISPGKLSLAHANLEGITNCTKCHVIGEKETTSKCLECHVEINSLIKQNKGYHASTEVKDKRCAECHGEHYGREFQLVIMDTTSFNHDLTAYSLVGKHNKIKCSDCHNENLIKDKLSQKKSQTYLGLGTDCLSCHTDTHQSTLSTNCLNCHNQDAFKPATLFDHNNSAYKLQGKHQEVSCEKCHKIELKNGDKFQQFKGVAYQNCTNCHQDTHENRFGNDCLKCHNYFSFKSTSNTLNNFNHNQTKYPLKGAHQNVDCKECHKTNYTASLKYGKCTDCHSDYHEGQLLKPGLKMDCSDCHSVNNFTSTNFTIEKHNTTKFQLEGAHLAVPCFLCHKTTEKWNFRNLGNTCSDCHKNIHDTYFDKKYMPDNDCKICHSVDIWSDIKFDHAKTEYNLEGKHKEASCRDCHFKESVEGKQQQFRWEENTCTNCHLDQHYGQFDNNGNTTCSDCHTFENWQPSLFDHNQTRFKLDGEHRDVSCIKCHPLVVEPNYSYHIYKLTDISCASCH